MNKRLSDAVVLQRLRSLHHAWTRRMRKWAHEEVEQHHHGSTPYSHAFAVYQNADIIYRRVKVLLDEFNARAQDQRAERLADARRKMGG